MNNQIKGYHDLTQRQIGGVHPIRTGLVHIAGHHVQIDTHVRQRCGWCGTLLLDYPLDRLAVPEDQNPSPHTWPTGHLIEVTTDASWEIPHRDDDRLPANTCAHLDAEITT
jgi:hypothetical protein